MTRTTYLGFPRIGQRRELKRALETYWRDDNAATLLDTARELRQRHWQKAKAAGIDTVAVNDFSLYDHVLDTALLFDAVPERYRPLLRSDPLAGYFAMARGNRDLHALEMTKCSIPTITIWYRSCTPVSALSSLATNRLPNGLRRKR